MESNFNITNYDDILIFDNCDIGNIDEVTKCLSNSYKDKSILHQIDDTYIKFFVIPLYRHTSYLDSGVYKASKEIFDVDLKTVVSPMRVIDIKSKPVFLCNDHCWALVAWIDATHSFDNKENITILHFDSHSDLGSPFLHYNISNFENAYHPLTNKKYDMSIIDNCFEAIARGNIGIGSFVLPFLVRHNSINFIHIHNHDTKFFEKSKTFVLKSTEFLSAPFQKLYLRDFTEGDSSLYLSSCNIHNLFNINFKDSLYIIDIDCDYFCNRNEGDVRDNITPLLTPKQLIEKISKLFDVLSELNISDKIVTFTVSFSPDFFPSQYWKLTQKTLLSYIHNLLK